MISNEKIFTAGKTPDFINESNTFRVDTHRHIWIIDVNNGNAYSINKKNKSVKSFFFQHRKEDPYSIYNYFSSDGHIQSSIKEGKKLIREIIQKNNISLEGKKVLDISGGNGHVAAEFKKMGARVVLTEVNENAINYAKKNLGIETYQFDFQKDKLSQVVNEKFDIILVRAAIMFCLDIDAFFSEIEKILNPGGMVILQYCVVPTLGTLLITQNDDYNYLALYQPETLIECCKKHHLFLTYRNDEIDRDPYVYGNDANLKLTLLRMWYEFKALQSIPFESIYPFRARDRQRSNMIFSHNIHDNSQSMPS